MGSVNFTTETVMLVKYNNRADPQQQKDDVEGAKSFAQAVSKSDSRIDRFLDKLAGAFIGLVNGMDSLLQGVENVLLYMGEKSKDAVMYMGKKSKDAVMSIAKSISRPASKAFNSAEKATPTIIKKMAEPFINLLRGIKNITLKTISRIGAFFDKIGPAIQKLNFMFQRVKHFISMAYFGKLALEPNKPMLERLFWLSLAIIEGGVFFALGKLQRDIDAGKAQVYTFNTYALDSII
ncbi:MAG: hypothetical protein OXC48_11345 [Endozoicomonadaceae bacterium]|nr:hypothetical protein [Endozoicomonadaceae bacterium]